MPRTIDEGFRDFLVKLTPSSSETEAAKRHRASIKACLESNFAMARFFRTGSFGNGTSIYGFSDVDYFAEIPRENLKQNSSATLAIVRNVLDKRFPYTGVHVDSPAVCLPFGANANEHTEVVPVDFIEQRNGYAIYEMPDCAGGWMYASPDAHNAYVRWIDQKLGGKVKPLIRFIKAWKYLCNVPISSFYLELRVAKYAETETSIIYDIDMKRVLAYLYNIDLAMMQDPMCISGYIIPCSTQAKRNDAKSKLQTALIRAIKARDEADKGNISEAFEWWNLLFNYSFPSYYR